MERYRKGSGETVEKENLRRQEGKVKERKGDDVLKELGKGMYCKGREEVVRQK